MTEPATPRPWGLSALVFGLVAGMLASMLVVGDAQYLLRERPDLQR